MVNKSITLIDNGKIGFEIVSNAQCALAEQESISFLQTIFSKLSIEKSNDIKPLIIAKDSAERLKAKGVLDDGYRIEVSQEKIMLSAYTDRGLLYSVYGFAERFLGVRFLHPTETIIPKQARVEIPLGEWVKNPLFDMRTYLNYFTLDGAEYAFSSSIRNNSNWLDLGERYGGKCPMFGRMRANGSIDHNILEFVPLDKYQDTHPEFYIKDRNAYGDLIKPDIVNGVAEDGTLDESMEESVAKSIIEEMKKDIWANPEMKYFSFEQEDGVCVVDKEKYGDLVAKYKESGVLLRLVNVVARALQKWSNEELNGREFYIVTFAYQGTADAPVYEKDGKYYPIDNTVIPEQNVVIRLALFADAYYGYFSDMEINKPIYEKLRSWSSICKKFMFWAYDIDFHDYFNYFPSFAHIKENVQGFYNLGVKYILIQGAHNFKQSWQCNLRAYMYHRLFNDINLSQEDLFTEYIDGFYGEIGGPCVKNFIARMDEHYAEVLKKYPQMKVASRTEIGKAPYVDKALLLDCMQLFDDTIANIENSALSAQNKQKFVARLEEVFITPLWTYINNYESFYGNIEGRKAWAVRFFAICKKLGINQFNEVALVFDPVEKYEIPTLYEKFGLTGGEIDAL